MRIARTALALPVLALVLAGCSGDPEPVTVPDPTDEQVAAFIASLDSQVVRVLSDDDYIEWGLSLCQSAADKGVNVGAVADDILASEYHTTFTEVASQSDSTDPDVLSARNMAYVAIAAADNICPDLG